MSIISVLGKGVSGVSLGSLEHKGAGHVPEKAVNPKVELPIVTMTSMVQLGKTREVFAADATQRLYSRFIQNSIFHMQQINRKNLECLAQCKALPSDADSAIIDPLLKQGFWFAKDYYNALVKFNKKKRLDLFVKSGNSFHGYAHPDFFEGLPNMSMPTKRETFVFCPKKGVLPSVALAKLSGGLLIADCGIARSLSVSLAIHDLLGPAKFNQLQPFNLNDVMAAFYDTIDITSEKDLQPGDLCHFSNIAEYILAQPFGDGSGQNVIYIGKGLFAPVSLEGTEDVNGISAERIEQIMWKALKEDPTPKGMLTPDIWSFVLKFHPQKTSSEEITWEAFKTLPSFLAKQGKKMQGKMVLSVNRANIKNVARLAQAQESEVGAIYKAILHEKAMKQLLALRLGS